MRGDVEQVLEQLAARGWLDDHRFAMEYVRYRAGSRRYGRHRIARELRAKGVANQIIEEALAEAGLGEADERELVRQRIARRLERHRPPYSDKLLRSLYASLLRAGFSSAIIRNELFALTRVGRARRRVSVEELALPECGPAVGEEDEGA